MRYPLFFTSFVLLLGFFLSPNYSRAEENIGCSPAAESVTIYQGDVLHKVVHVSHQDISYEVSFSVLQDLPELVNIHNQETLVIPQQEKNMDFFYDIDATSLAIGEYTENLQFILQDTIDSSSPEKNTVAYGLTEKIAISVIARPDPSLVIPITDYPTLIGDISASSLTSHQEVSDAHVQQVFLDWNLYNQGKNPLSGIQTALSVTHEGGTYFAKITDSSDVITLDTPLNQTANFVLDRFAPSGKYDVTLTVGDKTVSSSFWFVQRSLLLKIIAGISGTLLIVIAGLWMVLTRKQKHRKSR